MGWDASHFTILFMGNGMYFRKLKTVCLCIVFFCLTAIEAWAVQGQWGAFVYLFPKTSASVDSSTHSKLWPIKLRKRPLGLQMISSRKKAKPNGPVHSHRGIFVERQPDLWKAHGIDPGRVHQPKDFGSVRRHTVKIGGRVLQSRNTVCCDPTIKLHRRSDAPTTSEKCSQARHGNRATEYGGVPLIQDFCMVGTHPGKTPKLFLWKSNAVW